MPLTTTDVLVIGAGPAGCAAALILSEGCRVTLIERTDVSRTRVGESLPGAARPLLQRLNVWDRFIADGHVPSLGSASRWGSDVLTRRDSFTDPLGPGWRLNRARFDEMFRATTRDRSIQLITPATVSTLARNGNGSTGWRANLDLPGTTLAVDARFIVLAHGRQPVPAPFESSINLRTFDRLVCRYVIAPPAPESGLSGFTFVEAAPEGWWYQATLPDEKRILAYHTDADLPSARSARTIRGFNELLAASRSLNTSSMREDAAIRCASARSQELNPCSGPDWCAIGDTAAAFDPLSSQGLFHALYTGVRGGEAVTAALAGNDKAMTDYAARCAQVALAYRRNLTHYYSAEKRYQANLFWSRRQFSQQVNPRAERVVEFPAPKPDRQERRG